MSFATISTVLSLLLLLPPSMAEAPGWQMCLFQELNYNGDDLWVQRDNALSLESLECTLIRDISPAAPITARSALLDIIGPPDYGCRADFHGSIEDCKNDPVEASHGHIELMGSPDSPKPRAWWAEEGMDSFDTIKVTCTQHATGSAIPETSQTPTPQAI